MDAQIINASVAAICGSIGATAITGFFMLRSKRLDIAIQTRVQEHNEEKDEQLKQEKLTGGYRQMWQDAEAHRLAEGKIKDETIARITVELETARSELKVLQELRTKHLAANPGFSVDIEPNVQQIITK